MESKKKYLIIDLEKAKDTMNESENFCEFSKESILSYEEYIRLFKYTWGKAQESLQCTYLPEYGDFNEFTEDVLWKK